VGLGKSDCSHRSASSGPGRRLEKLSIAGPKARSNLYHHNQMRASDSVDTRAVAIRCTSEEARGGGQRHFSLRGVGTTKSRM